MLVNELLGGDVITCDTDTTLLEAARTMVKHDAGSIAVVEDGDLVGIVTERDLLRGMAEEVAGGSKVGGMMTPSPDFLEPDVEVAYAADWMLAAGYRHLPVISEGKLAGIVSIKDVLWGLTQGRA